MVDTKELRRIAQDCIFSPAKQPWERFNKVVGPGTVIELLDRIEALEKLCDANHAAYIAQVTR